MMIYESYCYAGVSASQMTCRQDNVHDTPLHAWSAAYAIPDHAFRPKIVALG